MNLPEAPCYLYSITNKVNGMEYFGITKDPAHRFKEHCWNTKAGSSSRIRMAIHKYGKESFEFKVILAGSRSYCMEMEAIAVRQLNTVTPNGYNICGGGHGPITVAIGENSYWHGKKFSKEHRDKIGNAHKGMKRSEETKAKLRQAFIGRPISEQQKEKIRQTLTGQKHSKEYKENMRNVMLGRKFTDEWKEKIRQANTGKTHNEETRKKLSEYKKANPATKEDHKKQSNTLKQRWQDPEFRQMMLEARVKKKLEVNCEY